ncbi:helix-turn-helix domain-containing protein [Halalkalibacter lacteus]|uniref:helix-turn-helix domain-containing protein n=1 Tax=Halalkalibacter lacteus TaxID=3090663 RepID=UPI002FC7E0D4
MLKRGYSAEDKLEILKACEGGQYSLNEITKIYNMHKSTIMEWRRKFDKYGSEGLKKSSTWKKYSKELKLAAIRGYQSGKYSLREITRKYELSDKSVLKKWIRKYNSHREIKDTGKGRNQSMTKGRSTT